MATGVFAADVFYDFDTDPSGIPGLQILQIGSDTHYPWLSYDGNPATGGFLDITDGANSQGTMIIFPVLDTVLGEAQPLKGFKLEADVRIGNGTATPADGFSISFARDADPILYWAGQATPALRGTAGGDSLAQASESASTPASCDAGNLECGTKTGVAVSFDAWNGNWWPANGVYPTGDDTIGVNIRVDDYNQFVLPTGVLNGACDDTNSLQTGPYDGTATYTPLCWAPLSVELTNSGSGPVINVAYKGAVLLTNQPVTISLPLYGRLILMGRTGGANQNQHVDNIHLVTVPSSEASLLGVSGTYNGFSFQLKDLGLSIVTNVSEVLLDGVDVTAQCTVEPKVGQITTVTYSQATWFAPLTTHAVDVTFETSVPQTLTGYGTWSIPNWVALPTTLALPSTAVSTPGFVFNSYQANAEQPNTLRFTEEVIAGLQGLNFATPNSGTFNQSVNIKNDANTGQFQPNANTTNTSAVTWDGFGIGANTAYVPQANTSGSGGGYDAYVDCALELFSYVYFPTSGVYKMLLGSDDGFRLSYGGNAKDRMGTDFFRFNGGRGIGAPGDLIAIKVDQEGAYPMRMLFENGTGGCNLEWYFLFGEANPTNYVLLGDPACPVIPYQVSTTAGAYVKSAVPVRDGQNVLSYQPVVVDLGDGVGASMAVDPTSVALMVDGVAQTVNATKSGDTTHVVQTGTINFAPGAHTNLLTFQDAGANLYSYTWTFSVIDLSTYAVMTLPATNRLDPSAIDHTHPGFLIRAYQTDSAIDPAGAQPNNILWTEQQLNGLHGANIGAPPSSYVAPVGYAYGAYDWFWGNVVLAPGVIDFSGRNDVGAWSRGEFLWNNDFNLVGIGFATTANPYDNTTLDIGCWLEFPTAGTYVMTVTSDDGFKLSSPYANPLNRASEFEIGRFDGGRGIGGPPDNGQAGPRGSYDYMVVNVPEAGAYPFRLIWENGGGGAGLEWRMYQFLPNGTLAQVLLGDTNGVPSVQPYMVANSVAPFVTSVNPVNGGTIQADAPIEIQLQDGTTTVNGTSVALKVNGATLSPTVTQSGGITTIQQAAPTDFWFNGNNMVELTFMDSGGTTRTYTYNFIAVYQTLICGFPLGSEDTTKPGFNFNVWQVHSDVGIGPDDFDDELLLSGAWSTNIANGSSFTVPGYINFSSQGDRGNFTSANGYPEDPVPGIPGTTGSTDYYATESLTYLVISNAGLYQFAVNSDDGFKLTPTFARPLNLGSLWVDAPASVAGPIYPITQPDVATAQSVTAQVSGKLVVTDPLLAGSALNNAAAVNGNIAVCRRGSFAFSVKIANCLNAGAIAVIVVNNDTTQGDVVMGATTPPGFQQVPAVSIRQAPGDALIAAAQAAPAYGTLAPYGPTQAGANGAIFDGGKGSSDVTFLVNVPAPGVYPVRLLWYEGGGDDNCEFLNIDRTTGEKILINDVGLPGHIPAFRALKAGVIPTLSMTPDGAGNVTIEWTGTLESTEAIGAQFRSVYGVSSPLTVPASSAAKFYRASVYNGP